MASLSLGSCQIQLEFDQVLVVDSVEVFEEEAVVAR